MRADGRPPARLDIDIEHLRRHWQRGRDDRQGPAALRSPPHGSYYALGSSGGPRDRTYRGYLLLENRWLRLQGSGASYSMFAMPR